LTSAPTKSTNVPARVAHPDYVDERSHALQETMLRLLTDQLSKKRLTPIAGETPGYRPPVTG